MLPRDMRPETRAILLRQGRLIDPAQNWDEVADIRLAAGKIAAVWHQLPPDGAAVYDCHGWWVVPGLVDVHCHLREPGFAQKETVATGTMAAARGGFTTVVAMANLNPVPDNVHTYQRIRKLLDAQAVVRVVQAASVTRNLRGLDLSDVASLAAAGVRIFSDDGQYIARAAVLYQALRWARRLDITLALHEEEASLKSYWPTAYHPMNEATAIARDLEILRAAGGRVHFQHVSTARSVALIRQAKCDGLAVSAEACPHHLTLTADTVAAYGTNAKMAPPLRTKQDQAALLAGLDDGTIDVIATDHAPHTRDDKNTMFDMAPNGIVGLETALPVLLTHLVQQRGRSPAWLIERLSTRPARLFGLPGGTLAPDGVADVCVIDPAATWKIDAAQFSSQGRNTPYDGATVQGRVIMTIVDGRVVYDAHARE